MTSPLDSPDLAHILLEDSYVLGVCARPGQLEILVEFLLTPDHADYSAPERSERACFRKGVLKVTGVRDLHWSGQGALQPAVDSTGELDWGGFDEATDGGGKLCFAGDFGRICCEAERVAVVLDDSLPACTYSRTVDRR